MQQNMDVHNIMKTDLRPIFVQPPSLEVQGQRMRQQNMKIEERQATALADLESSKSLACLTWSSSTTAWTRPTGSQRRRSWGNERFKGMTAPEDANSCVLPGPDPAPTAVARVSLARWTCLLLALLSMPISPCSLTNLTLLCELGRHPNKELLVRVSINFF